MLTCCGVLIFSFTFVCSPNLSQFILSTVHLPRFRNQFLSTNCRPWLDRSGLLGHVAPSAASFNKLRDQHAVADALHLPIFPRFTYDFVCPSPQEVVPRRFCQVGGESTNWEPCSKTRRHGGGVVWWSSCCLKNFDFCGQAAWRSMQCNTLVGDCIANDWKSKSSCYG